jgi:predicted aminopeptidase
MVKKALHLALVWAASALLSSCWYARQGAAFVGERLSARPLTSLARDPASPPELLRFIELVEDIRAFGMNELGLKPTKNYSSYVDSPKGYVADVLSACAADAFERHYWSYPFLGKLPYKGYYKREDAQKEAARLKAEGLDVIMRPVDAFSSLGMARDPVYSFMRDWDAYGLAELILHESLHATIFLKGQDQFNEEFASFVGRKGAELYLAARYGHNSEASMANARRRGDAARFAAFLKETAALLEALYGRQDLSREEKLAAKARVITERAARYKAEAEAYSAAAYRSFDMGGINNAYLDLFRLYEDDLSLYERLLEEKAQGSLKELIALVVAASKDYQALQRKKLAPPLMSAYLDTAPQFNAAP